MKTWIPPSYLSYSFNYVYRENNFLKKHLFLKHVNVCETMLVTPESRSSIKKVCILKTVLYLYPSGRFGLDPPTWLK